MPSCLIKEWDSLIPNVSMLLTFKQLKINLKYFYNGFYFHSNYQKIYSPQKNIIVNMLGYIIRFECYEFFPKLWSGMCDLFVLNNFQGLRAIQLNFFFLIDLVTMSLIKSIEDDLSRGVLQQILSFMNSYTVVENDDFSIKVGFLHNLISFE